MLDKPILNRIILSRHLFMLAINSCKSKDDIYLYSAVNLLQDSVEVFLIAVANFVNANIRENTKFDQYFEEINKKISPKELPFRGRLLLLNKHRVNSKHYGIQPPRSECESLINVVNEFYDEVSSKVFGYNYDSLSLLDLLEESECKDHLALAKEALEEKNYVLTAFECRKAIYIEIESKYDISKFANANTEDLKLMFEKSICKAPYYAKESNYIDKNVNEPTNYIVLDHSVLEQELIKYGIDLNMFWNVWRLTPDVFRFEGGRWAIKDEFDLLNEEKLMEVAPYIYASTVEIILAIQSYRKNAIQKNMVYSEITLAGEQIPVYKKADSKSKVLSIIPKEIKKVISTYCVDGLSDDNTYWYIINNEPNIYGFISNDNLDPLQNLRFLTVKG
ncbi:MAG: hypothetical protein CVU90_02095 [Firmicutes bacterium HGW-Firmicutes-15]|nr:MAG: hypothetical protein CVU90_02095 [Firmicutes bacterium HGW-Firmicutes-15]